LVLTHARSARCCNTSQTACAQRRYSASLIPSTGSAASRVLSASSYRALSKACRVSVHPASTQHLPSCPSPSPSSIHIPSHLHAQLPVLSSAPNPTPPPVRPRPEFCLTRLTLRDLEMSIVHRASSSISSTPSARSSCTSARVSLPIIAHKPAWAACHAARFCGRSATHPSWARASSVLGGGRDRARAVEMRRKATGMGSP
jgi:hypothetical protein